MNLKKFTILLQNSALQSQEKVNMLINLEQIVSIKPIKVSTETREVLEGYWIRLTNGKKYRAIQVPSFVTEQLNEELPAVLSHSEDSEEVTISLQ